LHVSPGASDKDLDVELGRLPSTPLRSGRERVVGDHNKRNISASPFAEAAAAGEMTTDDSDIDSALTVQPQPGVGNDALLKYIHDQGVRRAAAANAVAATGNTGRPPLENSTVVTVANGIAGGAAVAAAGVGAIEMQQRSGQLRYNDSAALHSVDDRQASSSLVDIRPWLFEFDQLEIIKVLGEGSFGRVYLCRWHETLIAVKILLEEADVRSVSTDIASLSNPMLGKLKEVRG
jgi:hypothetical protein